MSSPLFDLLKIGHHIDTDFDVLKSHLQSHHRTVVDSFHKTHRHAKKLFKKHEVSLKHIRNSATSMAAGAAMAGTLFVSPAMSAPPKADQISTAQAQIPPPPTTRLVSGPDNPEVKKLTQDQFAQKVKDIMASSQSREGKLSDAQFEQLQKLVSDQLGYDIARTTDKGLHTNYDYGFMGAEQHVPTHPGDSARNHVNKYDPTAIITGMTSGRAASGYVPAAEETWYTNWQLHVSDQLGTDAAKGVWGQRYIVIQVPNERNGWQSHVIMTGVWEAGPGTHTGKVYGGSPEVIHELGSQIAGGPRKDKVIYMPIKNGTPDTIPASKLGPQEFAK